MQVDTGGATLNYEVSGDPSNPPLVLWHGAGCTLRMWDAVLAGLKESFFCIACDIRGAGLSTVIPDILDQFTFEQYSQDLNLILKEF